MSSLQTLMPESIFSEEILSEIFSTPRSNVLSDPLESSSEHNFMLGNHWQQFDKPDRAGLVVTGAVLLTASVLAVIGNGIVIGLFFRYPSLHSPGNIIVVNLAVCDLLMATTGFPFAVVANINGHWPFSNAVCQLYGFLVGLLGLVSINSLAGIAVDRYRVIMQSQRLFKVSSSFRQSYVIIIISWIYALILSSPPLLGWNKYGLEGFGTSCSFDFVTKTWSSKSFVIYLATLGFFTPVLVIFYCYAYIYKEVKHHQQTSQKLLSSQKCGNHGSRCAMLKLDVQIAKVTLTCILLFCIAWLPYTIVSLVGIFGFTHLVTPWAVVLCGLFAKSSSIYNPIVYAIIHPKYKQKLWLLGHCKSKVRNNRKHTKLEMVQILKTTSY